MAEILQHPPFPPLIPKGITAPEFPAESPTLERSSCFPTLSPQPGTSPTAKTQPLFGFQPPKCVLEPLICCRVTIFVSNTLPKAARTGSRLPEPKPSAEEHRDCCPLRQAENNATIVSKPQAGKENKLYLKKKPTQFLPADKQNKSDPLRRGANKRAGRGVGR